MPKFWGRTSGALLPVRRTVAIVERVLKIMPRQRITIIIN